MINRIVFAVALLVSQFAVSSCDRAQIDDAEGAQIVHRGNGGDPNSLDPALADDEHSFNVLVDLYEGLLAVAADGSLIPGVAENWTVSDDGLSYTFHLRQDAQWSNGERVVAADFVRGFQRVATPSTASSYAFLLDPIANFPEALAAEKTPEEIGVSAPSPDTLQISLSRPTGHWLSITTMPVAFPAHSTGVSERISNGAFVLADRQIAGPIRLRRNDHFWDSESVHLDEVVFYPTDDSAAELNRYRAGELDITYSIPSNFIKTAFEEIPDEVFVAPTLALYYLALDLTEAPFDNKPLRQALSMAVDRQQLVTLIGRGEQAAYSIVPPGVAGHTGAAYDWEHLDKSAREQRAKTLLAEAGYSAEEPLKINIVYNTDDVHERIVLAVSAMWRDVLGVETTLVKKEWKYFLDTRAQRSEWDVMRFSWFGDYNAAATFLDIFESDNPQNLAQYRSPIYDQQLKIAASEVDASQIAELMRTAEATLINDYPVIPLYFFVSKHLIKPQVAGFKENVMDRHPSRFIRIVESE